MDERKSTQTGEKGRCCDRITKLDATVVWLLFSKFVYFENSLNKTHASLPKWDVAGRAGTLFPLALFNDSGVASLLYRSSTSG